MGSQKDSSFIELLNTFNWKASKKLQKVMTPVLNTTILLKENNKFKLHLKESLLIKQDKPEINGNIYSYPLELFD